MSKQMTAVLMHDELLTFDDGDNSAQIKASAGSELNVSEAFYDDDDNLWVTVSTTMDSDTYEADILYSRVVPKIQGITDKFFKS